MNSKQLCFCADEVNVSVYTVYLILGRFTDTFRDIPEELERETPALISLSLSLYNLLLYAWFKVNGACRSSSVWGRGAVFGGPTAVAS